MYQVSTVYLPCTRDAAVIEAATFLLCYHGVMLQHERQTVKRISNETQLCRRLCWMSGSYRSRRLGGEALGRGAQGRERAGVDLCGGRPWAPQL